MSDEVGIISIKKLTSNLLKYICGNNKWRQFKMFRLGNANKYQRDSL